MQRRISQEDLDAVVVGADSLASVDSLALLRQRAVELIGELVDATMVAWNEVDLNGRQIDAVMDPPLVRFTTRPVEAMSAAFIEHVSDHPVITYFRRTGDGRPHAISDFITAAEFRETGIYRHFYRHLGAEDQLSFVLPDPFLVIGIALNRRRRGFSARDRQVCNLIRSHLLQAYRSVEAASRLTRLTSTFEAAAGEHGLGLVRLKEDGAPVSIDLTAHAIMGRFFDLYSGECLPREISDWLARDRHRDSPVELVLHRSDRRRLIVHRAPTPSGDLVVLAEQPGTPFDGRTLGLTTRESEVLALVREGLATKRIAGALAISPRTVDKHIQHALDKLGVRTRLQAVTLIEQATTPKAHR